MGHAAGAGRRGSGSSVCRSGCVAGPGFRQRCSRCRRAGRQGCGIGAGSRLAGPRWIAPWVCSFQRVEVILPVQCPIVLILSDTGGTMETPADDPAERARDAERLRRFRTGFYRCLTGWADAAFELCDAALCAPAPITSVPTLSLEPAFRRSHGSLYKALSLGRVDHEGVRDLLVAHRPTTWPAVFAVDASTWARCDAETSPERGYYYSASKHSAGQPIVAGWSYQWITQLDWAFDSWTAPVAAARIPPTASPLTTLWLWWSGPGEPDLDLCWRAYLRRFDIEHTFRFVKSTLGWTTPALQTPDQADRWTWLVVAAYTQLRLARGLVDDQPGPAVGLVGGLQ